MRYLYWAQNPMISIVPPRKIGTRFHIFHHILKLRSPQQVRTTLKPVILQSATYRLWQLTKIFIGQWMLASLAGVARSWGREPGMKEVASRRQTSQASGGHGGSVPQKLLAAVICDLVCSSHTMCKCGGCSMNTQPHQTPRSERQTQWNFLWDLLFWSH